MTSGEQQVHNGRGRHKIGGNGRHLQRATSCSEWTQPQSNQVTKIIDKYCQTICSLYAKRQPFAFTPHPKQYPGATADPPLIAK
ncbi:hypothetical protein PoB_007566900 [Plakobranchus ocellatus]|uniref:Uncharacterized protein n=1 Tax=Plakobranchus ocellatus TaxID=259542 RepID=A0AAV4DY92_9GAST|nr:hypothetical protein PoB_007566900 [Plakobranchus ocellatus]